MRNKEAAQPPAISSDELLARFIVTKRWLRPDNTVKQDAFIPPKSLKLSITRHISLSIDELWRIGQVVAKTIAEKRQASLIGRADITVSVVSQQNLQVEVDPIIPEHPNHANLVGWPSDKPTQKIIAQQLSAASAFAPEPSVPPHDMTVMNEKSVVSVAVSAGCSGFTQSNAR